MGLAIQLEAIEFREGNSCASKDQVAHLLSFEPDLGEAFASLAICNPLVISQP